MGQRRKGRTQFCYYMPLFLMKRDCFSCFKLGILKQQTIQTIQTWPLRMNRNDCRASCPPVEAGQTRREQNLWLSMLLLLEDVVSQVRAQCKKRPYKHRRMWIRDHVDADKYECRQSFAKELLLVASVSKAILSPSKVKQEPGYSVYNLGDFWNHNSFITKCLKPSDITIKPCNIRCQVKEVPSLF